MGLNTRRPRLSIITFGVLLLSFTLFPLKVMAWETPVVIADSAGHTYAKPEIRYAANGALCIVYMDNNEASASHYSDIYMCTYDGKVMNYENVSNSTQYFSMPSAYESDVEATGDGKIHVAWVVKDRADSSGIHYIQYRCKDKNAWSNIVTLGTVDVDESDYAYDLRLGVSNNGNVHVMLSRGADAGVFYVAKYGSTITPVEMLGIGRSKHPDIAVNDNYVHGVWMQYNSEGLYEIVHQKWENKLGGIKSNIKTVASPYGDWGCGKVRMDLDSSGYYHVAMFFNYGEASRNLRYTKELPAGDLTDFIVVSDPEGPMLYHFPTLEVRDNSIITTMQQGLSDGGQGVFYNWNKNGQWVGYDVIPDTGGAVHDSVDLSADGKIAAVAFANYDSAIMLVTSDEIIPPITLKVKFTQPSMVFWGEHVLFNASQCVSLNPDFKIVSYKWDFGDGQSQTTTSNTITHQYGAYGMDVRVTLTITTSTGETGSISKKFRIHALYTAILTAAKKMQLRTLFRNQPAYEIQWKANPKNIDAGYPTITKYEIWRAPISSSAAHTDSSAGYGTGTRRTRADPGKPINPAVAAANYVFVTEVNAIVTKYLDYVGLHNGTGYAYSIISVDEDGHRSPFNRY